MKKWEWYDYYITVLVGLSVAVLFLPFAAWFFDWKLG